MAHKAHWTNFDEMVGVLATNSPHALILEWWRRVERALEYFTIAHYSRSFKNSTSALRHIESLAALDPQVLSALNGLRRIRNQVAHRASSSIDSLDAAAFAAVALRLIGTIADAVPNDLALSSGAARVA